MLFNSLEYILFLIAIVTVYWLSNLRVQNILLLAASYFFYSCWDWRFLSLIIISTVVDFYAASSIENARRANNQSKMRLFLIISVATNLGILGFFKYFNFFVSSASNLLNLIGLELSTTTLNIVLPVGISFYTFQTMSYTLDVYRGSLKPVRDMVAFALYVTYFPQLVAGPIERASRLLPQLTSKRAFSFDAASEGLLLILIGLFRKVVIADSAGALVDVYFDDPKGFSSLELATGLTLYSIQIYNDFAGYSNIARGSSRLLGIQLIRNFNLPYLASNVSEFWKRWHISLSTWLRDYLFISLGGSKGSRLLTFRNLMITMLLGGLWHGAGWNFVLWGALHGTYLGIYHLLKPVISKASLAINNRLVFKLYHFSAVLLIFSLVTFTWLFFRSPEISTALLYLKGLYAFSTNGYACLIPLATLLALGFCIDLPQAWSNNEFVLLKVPLILRGLILGGVLTLILLGGVRGSAQFIYFQF